MKAAPRLKTIFLAAASVSAATFAVAHAAAPVEPVRIEHAAAIADHGADHKDAEKAAPARVGGWAIVAGFAGAIAGLARLIGFRKIAAGVKAAGPVVASAAKSAAAATGGAVKAAARAAASPFRFGLAIVGLAGFALAGIGFYDVEWTGGLVLGALIAAMLSLGAGRMRRLFALTPRRRVSYLLTNKNNRLNYSKGGNASFPPY